MSAHVPPYISERIRQRPPSGLPVVPGSTPVVAFGDVRKARVATLGLNPSKIEFLDNSGNELVGDQRRLETHASLGTSDLEFGPDDLVARVLNGCNSYFQRRPYRWFNPLEKVLRATSTSYFDGSACHLDLVQWATDPTWSKLSRAHRQTLLASDIPFLRQQLAQEHIKLLLLNGKAIVRACAKWLDIDLTEVVADADTRVRIFTGRAESGAFVVGWNLNLQSSFGVTNEEIATVGNSVRRLAESAVGPPGKTVTVEEDHADRTLIKTAYQLAIPASEGAGDEDRTARLYDVLAASHLLVDFDWPEWQATAEEYVARPYRVAEVDLDTVRRLITTHVRKERFSDGHFYEMVRCGHIAALMRRLMVLYEMEA